MEACNDNQGQLMLPLLGCRGKGLGQIEEATRVLASCMYECSQTVQILHSADYIALGDIRFMPTQSEFATFRGFFKFWSNAPKFRSVGGGGGGMCMIFEICEKRPFQKCMGSVG